MIIDLNQEMEDQLTRVKDLADEAAQDAEQGFFSKLGNNITHPSDIFSLLDLDNCVNLSININYFTFFQLGRFFGR